MFDQIKNDERVIGKSRDGRFAVTMNGNQDILEVYVPPAELVKIEVEQGIKEAINDARTKIESLLRNKMMNLSQ